MNRHRREPNELEPVKELALHTCAMAGAFIVVFAVAAALEVFARYLTYRGWVDPASYIAFAMKFAARALVTIDVLTLIAVVSKRAWRLVRRT